MSYTVLAVKWRPRRFAQLVGQPHVVQALTNSLSAERLHHAYLFSGTRGVGKTTVARLLAKALNCDQGIVAEPCGECAACIAIDEGRFVDLLEVDAASRTKVDDTRELLDNVQYAPTRGRFKIYLIDEVHMLSNHSFNALLKTLEEPPPHVKFLLATTDPQKLPVTVLSRCLQFHLKKLSRTQIQDQLRAICTADEIDCDDEALAALARAADGSMRDALSLLDQAIAFGAGGITASQVNQMLGSIDRGHVLRILQALVDLDGAAIVGEVDQLEERAIDFNTALEEVMSALQKIAVVQLVKGRAVADGDEAFVELAGAMTTEDVQLYYDIAVRGLRDLAICRDLRMSFEMTLLRMLAFRPRMASEEASPARSGGRTSAPTASAASPASNAGKPSRAQPSQPQAPVARKPAPVQARDEHSPFDDLPPSPAPPDAAPPAPSNGAGNHSSSDESSLDHGDFSDWPGLLGSADVRGMARQLADHCEVAGVEGSRVHLVLAEGKQHLDTEQLRTRLVETLSAHLGRSIRLTIANGAPPRPTPAQKREAGENDRMRQARESIEQDANIRAVQAAFDAVVEADSIQPIEK